MKLKRSLKKFHDFEIDVKQRFPNAAFADGEILDCKISEEDRSEYKRLYEFVCLHKKQLYEQIDISKHIL